MLRHPLCVRTDRSCRGLGCGTPARRSEPKCTKGDPRLPTVLLVEDDPAALRFYADALRASGFLVQEASSGAEALRSAEADGPSVIVADLGLPDFDGFEVCRQVKLRPDTRQVPVIAITGRAMALRDIELAEEVGFQRGYHQTVPARGPRRGRRESAERVTDRDVGAQAAPQQRSNQGRAISTSTRIGRWSDASGTSEGSVITR